MNLSEPFELADASALEVPHAPRLSVVVSTCNRALTLRRVIAHLVTQDLPARDFELVVSDDGSSDGTAAVVAELSANVPFTLRYTWHSNRGPGFTHNQGIRAAAAPIVLLIADDILLAPGALSAHLAAHQTHAQRHCAILGNVRQAPELNASAFQRHWDPHGGIRHLTDDALLPCTLFWAINISFKRDFVLEHGLFREDLSRVAAAAHEDVELGCRLAARGLLLYHCKSADSLHAHPESPHSAAQRAYERGLQWPRFAALAQLEWLAVRYHVLNRRTWPEHLRALLRPPRGVLLPSDYGLGMFVKNLLRPVVYNGVLVRRLWQPLLDAAERSAWFERLVWPGLYRCVAEYHFRRGIRDAYRHGLNSTQRQA